MRTISLAQHAIVTRFNSDKTKQLSETPSARPKHWLDYAEPRFGRQLVHDTKCLLNVLVLYVTIPFYWALNEQTGSRWTLQASRMIGRIFDGYYTIKPDQMQVSMQVLLIGFIPLFETVVYPLLARIGIRRPLQRIALAMALAGTAFVLAGYVESQVARDYAVMPTKDACQLRVYNTWPHAISVSGIAPPLSSSDSDDLTVINHVDAMQTNVALAALNSSDVGPRTSRAAKLHVPGINSTIALPLTAGKAISYYHNGHKLVAFRDRVRKATSQRARLRVLVVWRDRATAQSLNDTSFADGQELLSNNTHASAGYVADGAPVLSLYDMTHDYMRYRRSSNDMQQFELAATRYTLRIGDYIVTDILELADGSVSTLLVVQRESNDTNAPVQFDVKLVELTPPNTMHMLWMLPQYTLLAAGEAIMGVTGMYFAYSESPESMKTVLQACWLLTIALGHLIDVIVVGANFISSQVKHEEATSTGLASGQHLNSISHQQIFLFFLQTLEFFTFAGLMYANILVFMWLVSRYQPLSPCPKLAMEQNDAKSKKTTDASKKPNVFTQNERA